MKTAEISFYSDGVLLKGAFHEPAEGVTRREPVVLMCSGFLGLRNIHPSRFARALTPRGYTVFGFDYRTFAPSSGETGCVILDEQVRDIANAVRLVRREIGGRPLVLGGWGMGGGLILSAAELTEPLAGVFCLNGFYDARRVQRALRGEAGLAKFHSELLGLQREALKSGERVWIDPFFAYPLDPVTQKYVDEVLRRDPEFGPKVWLPFADSLLSFAPERKLGHLGQTPLFIGHGRDNALHPAEEAESLYSLYPGPKKIHWLEKAGHTEWMLDEHPIFRGLVDELAGWLAERK
ncbi:MAG: alpha/beta hydrolase [Polyangiaceae bacterium]